MKAAILNAFGESLTITAIPDPVIGTGEVLVDVVAAPVLSYTNEVLSGERKYLLDTPLVPGVGAVGRVRAVGPDATKLKPNDWVLCDPTVRSRDDAVVPDILLQGWSAAGDGGLHLQRHFRHGPFAERMMIPTENAIPLGPIDDADAPLWSTLGTYLVPYGGLLAADLKAGETIVVSGATGHYGSAGVAVALAMGAGCVVAPGRNVGVLSDLVRRFGARLRPVQLTGQEAADREAIKAAAPGPIDCVLDLLPPLVSGTVVRAAAMSVRPYGRVILMGGVGMTDGETLNLPYRWLMRNGITVRGQWMFPRDATARLVRLARSGLLPLSLSEVTKFSLDQANDAVAHAASHGGPFRTTVICPG